MEKKSTVNQALDDIVFKIRSGNALNLGERNNIDETNEKIIFNSEILHKILDGNPDTQEWESMDYKNEIVKFVPLQSSSIDYYTVSELFRRSFPAGKAHTIEIFRVQNPYLLSAYLLKKRELRNRHPSVSERNLFHGTTADKALSICTNNFNWRLCGTQKGHIFGQGVSFSPIAYYSAWSCDKVSSEKVMLLANVLVAKTCIGTPITTIPPLSYDTTQKPNGDVIVKYEDDTFYPAYKIKFRLCGQMVNRRKNYSFLDMFDPYDL